MKKIRKTLAAMIVLAAVLLAGCSGSSLSDAFDEETVKSTAMEALELFNERKYQEIIDMGSKEMKEAITAEQFAEVSDPQLDKAGAFKEVTKTIVAGNTNKETGAEYGGVVMVAEYENAKLQFTIAFDEEMKLVEFRFQ